MDNWVAHFIEEERERQRTDSQTAAAAAQRMENVRFNLQTLVDLLSARVERDVEAFAVEFPDRALSFELNPLNGGFTVRREHYPEVKLIVEPNMNTGTIAVTYVAASETGTQTMKPKFLELGGFTSNTLHFRDEPTQHAFRTIAQLSEYLLVPVFTGRPR